MSAQAASPSPVGSASPGYAAYTPSPGPMDDATHLNVKPGLIPNKHFENPVTAGKALWEVPLDERRAVSQDPHVRVRLEQSRQFDGTVYKKLFDHVQGIAGKVIDDGNLPMDMETFSRLMVSLGITNHFLIRRLFRIFDYKKQSVVGVLDFMAMLDVILQGEYYDFFCQKIYQTLDVDSSGTISKARLLKVPVKNGRGITDQQLSTLKDFCSDALFKHSDPELLTYQDLHTAIRTKASMLFAFVSRIIEGMATVYANKDPPKPRKSELIDYVENRQRTPVPYDCDAFLLAELEKLNCHNAVAKMAGNEVKGGKKGKGKKGK
uniref:EF-hand domain-containing protein n=1 Tax=Eutreptiella gymnastica TaxID=73025 RepID=A0A7S1ILP5_9EUGL|mmetsp:Transcript_26180/g.47188  ORF Transcript_26180/g.47188 Transcript_26180/m.47188 type:complete len:321 (+) Transcript_26180:102-1064(+)